jgi:AcrR family transcriptional regulator
MVDNLDARARIFQAARQLLNQEAAVECITVRQIARAAGVGVGSIGYHFGSKDGLFTAIMEWEIDRTMQRFQAEMRTSTWGPVEQLKLFLKTAFDLAPDQKRLAEFVLLQVPRRGNMKIPLRLTALLKVCWNQEKDERQVRTMALQILRPLESAIIAPEAFRMYSGVDIYDAPMRNRWIDELVDNVVGPS